MPECRHVALVAHDNKKADLLVWCERHKQQLTSHHLYATGTTGALLNQQLGLKVHPLMSGPLGGDQQIGAMIAELRLDTLIFFWDPLSSQPHDPDVKALLRLAAVWNIPSLSSNDFYAWSGRATTHFNMSKGRLFYSEVVAVDSIAPNGN
ncbi:methylglyoxal synthase [Elysia marginata]|uniref:Methylglyoxal synthase n=1 Tax=Elysia marginata TaxID=1093978 RepID=A0AAV4FEG9_9GAST|nr:methylglyoxal synthase [Elysia marginata]